MVRALLGPEVAHVGCAPEQDVLADGDVSRDQRHLRDESKGTRPLPSRQLRRVLAEQSHDALVRDQTGDGSQRRRLPRAVGTDERDPFSVVHVRSQPFDHVLPAERDRDSIERDRRHQYRLLVRRTTAKNGAPKNAVTTPIGSSAGDITVRAITSAKTRKPAPSTIDNGSSTR